MLRVVCASMAHTAPECPSAHEQRCDARCCSRRMERVRSARRCCGLLQRSIVLATAAAVQRMLLSAQSWHKPHKTPARTHAAGQGASRAFQLQQPSSVASVQHAAAVERDNMVTESRRSSCCCQCSNNCRGPGQQHWQQLQQRGAQPAFLRPEPFQISCRRLLQHLPWVALALHERMGHRA